MLKAKNKQRHRLSVWQEDELVRYGRLAQIQGIEKLVRDNVLYIGGNVRYALIKDAAREAIDYALAETNGQALMKFMTNESKAARTRTEISLINCCTITIHERSN
jgi:hypothetical protein